jgi:phosphatidylglycerol:prolipoprotein diacylglycerol transferase
MLLAVDYAYYAKNPRELFTVFQSGGVFYGGLLGGLLVAYLLARRYALPVWATADVLAPGVIIGQSIGRLGCFAAGCCHGRPADVPWAVTFTDVYASRQVGTPLDTPLHPSQLYESLAALLIFGVLVWLAPRKKFHGQVVLAYVVLYSATRFGLEFFRGDAGRGFIGPLSTSQAVAVGLILLAALAFGKLRKTPLLPPGAATPAGDAPATPAAS